MEYRFSKSLKNLKPSAIREIFKSLTDPEVIAFAAGNPAATSFPAADIAGAVSDILNENATAALQYGTTEGYPPLREAIAVRIRTKFGIGGEGDDTMIVSGGQQGLELAAKVFCDDGDAVLCEETSFIGALNSFRSLGAETVGVKCDEEGIIPESLEICCREMARAKLLYVIPTFHNPCGTTTSLCRRREIYAVCKKYGVMILEDNPYGELRFSGEDVPTIKSMDADGIVIYCSSFSKLLSAGMRVGYVCAPREVMQKMVVAKQGEDVHTNMISQMIVHRLMTEYDFEGHIRSVAELYGKKCRIMMDALDKYMPRSVKWTRPDGGLFVWLTLPKEVDQSEFIRRAMENKVAVVPGEAFSTDMCPSSQSFRITYSTPTEDEIVRGVETLGAIAEKMLK